ncbi:MAG: hypothetical protein OEZ34_09175, partial [Spirochaetia bacterium]|nr:hypothetical protein [Spirochaetia bacterium]
TELMMSAMLCDIGTEKMKMPGHRFLKKEEMDYVKNHPLLSYLLIAHEPSIHPNIKRNILCHHRPLRDDLSSNNYPPIKLLLEKLEALRNKYHNEPGHLEIANDIAGQIQLLKNDLPYDENANILAIASAFASLTSDVPWREAYEPAEAVRMIINNSLFSYSQRTLRDFLDHVAISLCDNRKIINEGDFVITNIKDSEGKNFFEAGIISKSDRYQSRPQIDRFASIEPIFQKHPLMHIEGFNLETLKLDPRSAHFDLRKDDSRHIAYLVDKFENEELYKQLARMTGQL